jgi:cellulose synthase/poly-beta-1,6-N-acetylglucosamine synthase-like glycosyltransferase
VILVSYILIAIGVYSTIHVLYHVLLFAVHFFMNDREVPLLPQKVRFGVIIPAYNEELFLGRLLRSINRQKYPIDMFKAIVVADNSTDRTAQVGLENNAIVLERFDRQRHGKGYAIRHALERIDLDQYDAIFIIDADSIIGSDVLERLNQVILGGSHVIQCYNGVANPDESWFTRLLDVSRTIGNEILQPAKEKLGLSSCLMGNGMCFSKKILLKYGWEAFTVGEDWEYYARLIEEGETVAFAHKARVYHQESSSLRQATSQRIRWSSGRFAIAWKYGFRILFRGLIEGNIRKIDASFPLIFPNPSLGMNITIAGFVLSLLLPIEMNKYGFILWFSSLALLQFVIFIIGIMYTHNKLKKFYSLFVAPLFLFWKMGIDFFAALGFGRKRWVRTERKI